MITAADLLDVLNDQPEAPILWGTLDNRLDAEARTLPAERECLVDVARALPPDKPLVAWHEGRKAIYVRTWLPLRDGAVILYLDFMD